MIMSPVAVTLFLFIGVVAGISLGYVLHEGVNKTAPSKLPRLH